MSIRAAAVAGFGLLLASPSAIAADAVLETISTPRGARVAVLLVKPAKPVAAVILMAGGHGGLGLSDGGRMRWGEGNFLVRTRQQFAARNLLVAVMDAPSDHAKGMNAMFRMSDSHATDIAAVATRLKTIASVPVWAVGTSMGTFSAAQAAVGAKGIDGLVLTSTITRAKPDWKIAGSHPDGVGSMPLERVKIPTLVVSHRNDGCEITPAADAPKLTRRLKNARKVEVALLDGGTPPISAPCEAKSQHGFLGIEAQAVDRIAAFVTAN